MSIYIHYNDVDYKAEREAQRAHFKEMVAGIKQPAKPSDLIKLSAEVRCMQAYAVNFKGDKGGLAAEEPAGKPSQEEKPVEVPSAKEPETTPEVDQVPGEDQE